MELVEADFSGGVAEAFGLVEAEGRRLQVARARLRHLARDPNCDDAAYEAAAAEATPLPPLWQRITGFRMKDVGFVAPSALRAGIRRLLRVVEKLYRAELKTEDVDDDGAPSKLDSGEVSFAGRSAFWDPLDEICTTLGIAPRSLSTLCKMRTDLRSREMCDAIRAEHLRTDVRQRFCGLMAAWRESLTTEQLALMARDFEGSACRFLKWMRGGGRGKNRKSLAFEYGMTSSERLSRSVYLTSGETLEELEVAVAMEVIRETFGDMERSKGVAPKEGSAGTQGAYFGGVVSPLNPWANGRFEDEAAGD